jgi:phage terminase large subunit-like protein
VKRDGQDVIVTRGRTSDNAANLAPSFLSQIVARYEGRRLGRRELNAELLEDVQGALWSRDLLEEVRRDKAPPMRRIVVAIDPAVSVSENADETGIIVAGLGTDDHGYVLEDASGKYSPIEWARRTVALYHKHGADRIIAEANQGGLMVETTVRTVDANISFKAQAGAGVRSEVSERMIRMLAPPGVGAALLLSGRDVPVPTDRVVEMTMEDAKPLFRGGWIRITANLPTGAS